MCCDLHLHSTASDGTDAPEILPVQARNAGLKALALTDHDTTAGLAACEESARSINIHFVPGIELSADPMFIYPECDQLDELESQQLQTARLHILGYFIDYHATHLQKLQDRLVKARADRNPKMIHKLNELGVKIDYNEVLEVAGTTQDGDDPSLIIGRPHIAQVMVNKGYVKSIHAAFAKYIGSSGAAYVSKDRLTVQETITAIHQAGGLACLAHPAQLGITDHEELEHLVARMVDLGLNGIETIHSDHTPSDAHLYEKLAQRFNLINTGGSDYHGSRKSIKIGKPRVPISVYEALAATWGKYHDNKPTR